MIDNDRENKATKDVHTENLYRVVQYCENQSECRRVQLLGYFGETDFTSDQCSNGSSPCDNCQSSQSFESKDVTEDAKAFVEAVNNIVHKGNRNFRRPLAQVTLNHMVDIFKVGFSKQLTKIHCTNLMILMTKFHNSFSLYLCSR